MSESRVSPDEELELEEPEDSEREQPESSVVPGKGVAAGTEAPDFIGSSRLPEFSSFAAPKIYDNLQNIFGFDLVIEVPKMYRIVGVEWSALIVGRMYEAVLSTLDSSGFHRADMLATINSDAQAGVRFRDDEYQFDVFFDQDGDLHIQRGGSTLERFYNWYSRLMPSAMSLVDVILNAAAEVISISLYGREVAGVRRRDFKLTPVAVAYSFRFIAYDFEQSQSRETEKNVGVLRGLLRVVPGQTGELQDPAQLDELGHLGKIDVTLSRFVQDIPDSWSQEFYSVSGPSERRYTMLLMTFTYRGESFDTPDGKRQKFRPDLLLNNYETPILSFLKQRAIEKFLTQLTVNYHKFQTSTGSLP